MSPRARVQNIEPLTGFIVRVTFDNNTQREINLEPYLHGEIFEPIRQNPAIFRAMKIEGGTIAWDNGADIDPDVLYYNLTPCLGRDARVTSSRRESEVREITTSH